jgi:hypothetical protein
MRKLLVAAAFLAMTAGTISAQAQDRSLRALLGFDRGAIHLGADFEMKQSNLHGLGGYFFFQTDDEDNGVASVMALGANIPIHLLNHSTLDAYIAPGFGIAMYELGLVDETLFGPSVKIGVDYKVAPTTKVGVQYSKYYNWMSDEVDSNLEFASASITFGF